MSQVAGVGTSSSENIRTDYMSLLVTQLRHQNPLEPMSSEQMASQLSQLAQLEQVERLNSTFGQVLQAEQANQAAGLIGKEVSFYVEGQEEPYVGPVKSVQLIGDKIGLIVDDYIIGVEGIQSISGGLGSALSDAFLTEQMNQASGLIGKDVSFIPTVDGNGKPFEDDTIPEAITGTVESVGVDGSKVTLTVGGYEVDYEKILSITG